VHKRSDAAAAPSFLFVRRRSSLSINLNGSLASEISGLRSKKVSRVLPIKCPLSVI
jgi:hypothetical protein